MKFCIIKMIDLLLFNLVYIFVVYVIHNINQKKYNMNLSYNSDI